MTLERSIRLIALLLFVLVLSQLVHAQETPLNGFDDYVNKALRDWQVPGIAIAVVKNDQVVFAKGYGVRKLGESTSRRQVESGCAGTARLRSNASRSDTLPHSRRT